MAAPTHGPEILPMDVANTPFLVDRLGEDCAPLQFLRELTQNAIEAITDTREQRGHIVWDVDRNLLSLDSKRKLSIIDTGCGMTGPEMVQLVNRLSSSRHEQSSGGNFGVGAKIAAATRNHAGVVYLSWKDGQGAMVRLVRTEGGTYGLSRFERPDGSYMDWAPIDDDVKPSQIKKHGTMVTLLGMQQDDDTMTAPEGTPLPARWVTKYLNTRYFAFPSGITVSAREGLDFPEGNDNNRLRPITGQQPWLDKNSTKKGTVELTGATARWWIVADDVRGHFGHYEAHGHTAALFQNELYELLTGRTGYARLQQFGVVFGYQRVVLYVEPKNGAKAKLTANTARTQLVLAGDPLPWSEWAEEFRNNLPSEINDLMEEVTAGALSTDHKQAIRDRLKQIAELFRISRYRPAAHGSLEVDGKLGDRRRAPDSENEIELPRGGPSESPKRRAGRGEDVYALFIKAGGVPGEELPPRDNYPRVDWVSVERGTRAAGVMEDRAATYLREQNVLQINEDFRGFTDMIKRWTKQYEKVPAAASTVTDVVHEWFEQALVETVVGTLSLRDAKYWSSDQISAALSDEALTAAAMQRYHIDVNVRRSLGARLGSLTKLTS